MTSEGGKVARRLTIKLEPMRGDKFSVTVIDSTTRSKESERDNHDLQTADTWTRDSAVESFELVLREFVKSLKSEDPGELFADEKSSKPRLDKK